MSIWVCFLIGLGAGILLGGSLSFFYFQLSKTKLEAALQKSRWFLTRQCSSGI